MSITDELREYVRHYSVAGSRKDETLTAIANRIDAEHEKSVVDALLNDGLPMSDEVMAEHGWVRLPKDADGVPIEGGLMESVDKLRMQVKALNGHRMSDASEEKILAIADEIEREHGKLTHNAVCKAHADGEKNGLRQVLGTNASYEKGRKDAEGDAVETLKWIADAVAKGRDVFLFGSIYTPLPDTWERIIADAYGGGHNDPDNEVMRKRLIDRCKALAGEE